MILGAIERVTRHDRSAVTDAAFATRDFDGALGRWSFDANGDIDLRRCTRLTVRDGRHPLEAGRFGCTSSQAARFNADGGHVRRDIPEPTRPTTLGRWW